MVESQMVGGGGGDMNLVDTQMQGQVGGQPGMQQAQGMTQQQGMPGQTGMP